MKRFRFSLQAVAVLRAHHEMRAQEAFAAAMQVVRRAESELLAVRNRVTQIELALARGRQGKFSAADEIQALASYRLERVAEHAAEASVVTARTAMHQRQSEYLEAHRNVDVVERLEQKARAVHRQECNREEQAGFDDFASRRFGRARTETSV